jgi:hypothetical protein
MTSLVLLLGDQLNVTVGEAIQQAKAKAASLEAVEEKESDVNSTTQP